MVPHDDPAMLVVAAAIHRQYLARNATISGQMPGHEYKPGSDFDVLMSGERHRSPSAAEGGWDVRFGDSMYALRSDWQFGGSPLPGTLNGQPVCMQVERRGSLYRLFHWGVPGRCAGHERARRGVAGADADQGGADMTRQVPAARPCPACSHVAVVVGPGGEGREILAKIEAMKMENVLKAERDCVVGTPGCDWSGSGPRECESSRFPGGFPLMLLRTTTA